jgi:hypothetical protein
VSSLYKVNPRLTESYNCPDNINYTNRSQDPSDSQKLHKRRLHHPVKGFCKKTRRQSRLAQVNQLHIFFLSGKCSIIPHKALKIGKKEGKKGKKGEKKKTLNISVFNCWLE